MSIPSTQTALVMTAKEKAELKKDAPVPSLKDDEIMIEVHAAGINPVDWKTLFYNFQGFSLPHGLGNDVSGIVRAVGKEVKDFKAGDEVVGSTNLWNPGSFAQYVPLQHYRATHKKSKVSHVQAASLPIAFLSAWDGFDKVKVEEKQTIFVSGGAGGVGNFITQLAKIHKLTVFASGGKEDSLNILKELKVDHILNYQKQNVVDEILKVESKGVDIVFDSTYQDSSFVNSAKALKEGGTFIVLGSNLKEDSEAGKILKEKKAKLVQADLIPYSYPSPTAEVQKKVYGGGLDDAQKYIEEGKLTTFTKTVDLDGLLDTLLALKSGKTPPGKLVLEISHSSSTSAPRPGGIGTEHKADEESNAAFAQVKDAILEKAGADKKATAELISYGKQVVAGLNFFAKVKITHGDDVKYVHARIFRSLKQEVSLVSIETGKTADDPITYF